MHSIVLLVVAELSMQLSQRNCSNSKRLQANIETLKRPCFFNSENGILFICKITNEGCDDSNQVYCLVYTLISQVTQLINPNIASRCFYCPGSMYTMVNSLLIRKSRNLFAVEQEDSFEKGMYTTTLTTSKSLLSKQVNDRELYQDQLER